MPGRSQRGAVLAAVLTGVLVGCAPSPQTASPTPIRTVPVVATVGPALEFAIGTGAVDTWNGWLPDGRTFNPFDTSAQPVARLDPMLLAAIQDATKAAAADGVTITLTSGWRSKGFQQRLFADGVRQYGSVAAAQEFVASPDASKHVVGQAVDIAGDGASRWMIENGAQFGLCQIFANENWHFELAADADGTCPPLRPNAAG